MSFFRSRCRVPRPASQMVGAGRSNDMICTVCLPRGDIVLFVLGIGAVIAVVIAWFAIAAFD